ncbi:single-stranded DNA-binding protein [Pseudoscardovia radai]|uniref:Single-stranded DNA-binding protein n=1 Tax=Pseudoscardovia radai TaxID=987066 RepID=A0A261EX92_9BIFI|nr:single-stranded DNA-binding protein [Pseudoscardovia radai]OZG51276.1 single-stranded DNA-binding protein [Pseudoscardovia radai]
MAQQSMVTVTGYVGGEPRLIGDVGKVPCCVFRVASTRRYFSQREGRWEDLPTTWMSVRAYRQLALNVKESISRGDPVIINGQLVSDSWKAQDGSMRTALSIEAASIGHDLSRGVSSFERKSRNSKPSQVAQDEEDAARAAVSSMEARASGGGAPPAGSGQTFGVTRPFGSGDGASGEDDARGVDAEAAGEGEAADAAEDAEESEPGGAGFRPGVF